MCPSQKKRSAKFFHKRKMSTSRYKFYKENIEQLCERFPNSFNRMFPKPLKIGIDKDIIAETGMDEASVMALLAVWTRRHEYTYMACSVGKRYDLHGNPVSALSEPDLIRFISIAKDIAKDKLHSFTKSYLEVFGRPALICIPIKERPEL